MIGSLRWFYILVAALAALLGTAPEVAIAADPTMYAIRTDPDRMLPEATLNGEVRVWIDGDAIDPKKAQLWIDGSSLGVDPRVLRTPPDRVELVYPLLRTEQNRKMWSRLLGSPFEGNRKTVPVSVQYGDKPLKWRDPPQSGDASESKITLVTYNKGLMVLGIVVSLAVLVITVLVALRTAMMRDSLIPQMRLTDRPFSLGRLQMLVWFCLIFGSFLFIFAVTLDMNSITAESFILLGISGTTALASVAIDVNKDGPVEDARKQIAALGIKSRDETDKLFEANKTSPGAAASTVVPGAKIGSNANPTIGELWNAYWDAIKSVRSTKLLEDLVNDAHGPTIHRWQILIWTTVLAAIYIGMVYANLETPTFGTNLLALMGISGGVYLGFKIPEKQT